VRRACALYVLWQPPLRQAAELTTASTQADGFQASSILDILLGPEGFPNQMIPLLRR